MDHVVHRKGDRSRAARARLDHIPHPLSHPRVATMADAPEPRRSQRERKQATQFVSGTPQSCLSARDGASRASQSTAPFSTSANGPTRRTTKKTTRMTR